MTLYIPPELQSQMQSAAGIAGLSVSEWVRFVVTEYIEKRYEPQELFDPEDSPLMQDLILQRLDKFIFDYQIMKERLEMLKQAQKDTQSTIETLIKDNPEAFKMSDEQVKTLMEFGKATMEKMQESVTKQVEAKVKKKK
jgi:hypothetical protein